MPAPRLELRQVFKTYLSDGQKVEALRGVSLALEPGTVTALVGRSGCGKSTLLNLAGAMDFPTSGEVLIDGRATSHAERRRIDRAAPHADRLRLSILPTSADADRSRKCRAAAAARRPQRDSGTRARSPALGGTRRKSGIDAVPALRRPDAARGDRRALWCNSPQILIADEPTGNLDTASGDQVLALLRESAARFSAPPS